METRRIDLKGNRSLINNKAHIDEAWQKFSKNNSPYLRDALVPHYVKEENKEIASNIVFDKKGNKYYVNDEHFFVNDEIFADVSSIGFHKIDLSEEYQCYDVNGPAYILNNILFYKDYNYQFTYEILFSRVRTINDSAYFIVVYYNGENILSQRLVVITGEGDIYTEDKQIVWGQLINGTTWTTVSDPNVVSSFRCNIASLSGQEGDSCVGFSLIGNASSNNKESDLYFYNSIYDIDEEKFFCGSEIEWEGVDGELSLDFAWRVPYKVTHTRTYKSDGQTYYGVTNPGETGGKWFTTMQKAEEWCKHLFSSSYVVADTGVYYTALPAEFQNSSKETNVRYYRAWGYTTTILTRTADYWELTDMFKISLPESSQNHTGVSQECVLTYHDRNNVEQILSGTISNTQKEITLSRFISSYDMDSDFKAQLTEMFNIDSITITQTIDETDYTKSFPVENITFLPTNNTEEYTGFLDDSTETGVLFTIDLTPYVDSGEQTYILWEWTVTEEIDAPDTLCNLFDDSGILRSVPVYTYKQNNITEYIVSGNVYSLIRSGDTITVSFTVARIFKNTATYTYFASSSYNINQGYFDVLFALFDNSYTESKTHNFYTNTGLNREIIGDIGMTNAGTTPYVNGSAKGKLWFTQYGAIAPLVGTKWRLLFNYGNISNISYGESEEEGSALTEWNTIDDQFYISYNDSDIVYKDITGIHQISIMSNYDNLQIFEDNFVLINTTSYLNCYDIKNKRMVHFASDFNNRCYTGWQASSYGFFLNSGSWKDAWESNKWESDTAVIFCAAGQNVNYAISGSPVVSSIFPPQNLYHVVKGKEYYCYGDNASVDIYYSLLYQYSLKKNLVKYVNSTLYPDAQYPLSSNNVNYFNMPLLLILIKTYNNKDLVKVGTMYYPIVYYNDNIPIFIYSTLGGLDGASSMFVIQSQFYAVMNGKICAVSYADNIIAGVEAIIDVTGMEFIGYLPTFALFYSPKNKCIYSFTGDANLELVEDASEIGELRNALYNSFTKTIHVITDKGVCIIGDTIYMIEFPGIAEMFFTEEKTVLETEDKIYYLSFDKLSDEYEVMPLEFETEFFGGVNDSVITIYKWSMRFIKDAVTNGTIKLSTVTLTDKGSETREKVYNLTAKDWDPLTESFYLQFAPENNKACGHKIRIESDFPLTSLVAQITTDGSLAAAKNSLKI